MRGRTARRLERGGALAIVAVLVGFGVALGMGAIAIDVGNIMVERRQLQNSADSASLSLAQDCWANPSACAVNTVADDLADANASDGSAQIVSACSENIPGSPIDGCPSPPTTVADGTLTECAALPSTLGSFTNLPYVEVRTRTENGSGGSTITNQIGQAIGQPTATVDACARAAVGAVGTGEGDLPITISACEWMRATGGTVGGGGGAYYPSPDYDANPMYGYSSAGTPLWPEGPLDPPAVGLGREAILLVQNPPGGQTAPSPCPDWQGHALPGGFGLLETESGNPCKLREYPFSWMHTDPGNSTNCDLSARVGTVVNVPVFACTSDTLLARDPNSTDPCDTGNGSNAYYWRAGYAQFYLSGYGATTTGSIPNRVASVNPNNTRPPGQNPCQSSETCISGWFVSGSLSATVITGPPTGTGYFGTYGVVPAG